MGWANCGEDSRGRPIGYAVDATCDLEGCGEGIHRGLAYACGDMHGAGDDYCEGYFCYGHLVHTERGLRCRACSATMYEEEQ